MTFQTILFGPESTELEKSNSSVPDFFVDLNLNQIETSLFSGREAYSLADIFRGALHDPQNVAFRQAVMKDLEQSMMQTAVKLFVANLGKVRDCLTRRDKTYYRRQKEWWFFDAVDQYGATMTALQGFLHKGDYASTGLKAFSGYLTTYIHDNSFKEMISQARSLKNRLHAVRYTALIRGLRVDVRDEVDARDYGAEVLETFERFRQGEVSRYSFEFRDGIDMNHVEAQILEGVARLNSDLFNEAAAFFDGHQDFVDPVIDRFNREVQFYIAYLDYIAPLRSSGLSFCYPETATADREFHIEGGFDLALAQKLQKGSRHPVPNSFELKSGERLVVVSGPNQGGKTTFARMIGQCHYLAALGYPIPGASACLELPDQIFTHFEREEQLQNLRGKLEDDIFRIHKIVEGATAQSLVLINEMFTSTSLRDAVFLSQRVARMLLERRAVCIWVTFLDELSRLGPETVSMTSMVKADNTAERTFQVVRRAADGHAYAMSIAEKYHLTYDNIRERINDESAPSLS